MDRARILIADDEVRMRDSIKLLLADPGYLIHTAGSGREAVRMAGQGRYDLILLDLYLGDVTGYEVMERIKVVSPDSLMVMITGAASIKSAVQALRQGAYSYLSKPFEPEELLTTVQNALTQKKLEADKRRVALALQASEKRFGHLVESLPDGVLILQEQRVVYENPAAVDILGVLADKKIAETFDCLHPEDRSSVSQGYRRLLEGRPDIFEAEFRLYRDSGNLGRTMYWLRGRANLFEYLGAPAILVLVLDVTRSKEIERMLSIRSKMHSLGRVAAGVAHEIRNPLTGINSFLFSLRNLAESDELEAGDLETLREISANLQTASDKIERVIRRVLDFAKPGLPRLERICLNEAVREAALLSATILRKNGIVLNLQLMEGLPDCRGDQQLLEQVVLNLIDNAAQILGGFDGRKIIEVKTFYAEDRLVLTVSDTGPGVPEEHRADIFDPFFTTRSNGSGIGLSLTHRIITDHGGVVMVDRSALGGAEFRVVLPVCKES
jgi:PAS domain S-box-containing protein